jgi:hypothetical protein
MVNESVCDILAAKGAQNIPVEVPVEVQNPGRRESSTDRNPRRNYVRNEFKEQVSVVYMHVYLIFRN